VNNSPHHTPSASGRASHRWRALFARVFIATMLAWILINVPLPRLAPHIWVAYVQVPLVIFLLICYLGKLLIDTFFYNRYS